MARTEVTGRQIKDGSVSLVDDVVNTLPVANGGTGVATLASGSVLVGAGTGAVQVVFPGTTGNVLSSNGSTWVSAAASGTAVSSVAGRTGAVVLTSTDVGLANVDNTSDATKNSAAATLTSKILTNPTINNYTEGFVNIGTVGATNILSLTSGTVQHATLTASTPTTFTMPAVGAGKSFTLMLKQPAATGGGSATFTSVKWPTSGAPTITAGAGRMDILSFFSDTSSWYGSAAQGYTY